MRELVEGKRGRHGMSRGKTIAGIARRRPESDGAVCGRGKDASNGMDEVMAGRGAARRGDYSL